MKSVPIAYEALSMLAEEPDHLLTAYAWLVSRCDHQTAVVGHRTRISEQFLLERLGHEACQGRKASKFTRQKVRSTIARLETIGLIESVGDFVFKLPYQLSHSSVQNNNNQTNTQTATRTVLPQVIENNEESTEQQPEQNQNNNPNNNPPLSINLSINQEEPDAFAMHNDWEPTAPFFEQARFERFDVHKDYTGKDVALLRKALVDVRLYWQSQQHLAKQKRSQFKWHKALLGTMKSMRMRGVTNEGSKRSSTNSGGNTGGMSAAERNARAARAFAARRGLS